MDYSFPRLPRILFKITLTIFISSLMIKSSQGADKVSREISEGWLTYDNYFDNFLDFAVISQECGCGVLLRSACPFFDISVATEIIEPLAAPYLCA